MTDNPHYERIGGEAKIRELVERFYELMDTLPETQEIRRMHARDLRISKEKLFMFLSAGSVGRSFTWRNTAIPTAPTPHALRGRQRCTRPVDALHDPGDGGCRYRRVHAQELEEAFYKTADFMRNQPE